MTLNEQVVEALGWERCLCALGDNHWKQSPGDPVMGGAALHPTREVPDYTGDANEWMKLVEQMLEEGLKVAIVCDARNQTVWFGPVGGIEDGITGDIGESVCHAFLETRP